MGNSPRGKATVSSVPKKANDEETLPTVETIGLAKVPRGWVVVAVTVQGDKVVGKEVLSKDPENKANAAKRAMNEMIKAFVMPKAGVEA